MQSYGLKQTTHSFLCLSTMMWWYHCQCVRITSRQDSMGHGTGRYVTSPSSWICADSRQPFRRVRGAPIWAGGAICGCEVLLSSSPSTSSMMRTGSRIWAGGAICGCEVLLSSSPSTTSSMLRMDTASVFNVRFVRLVGGEGHSL